MIEQYLHHVLSDQILFYSSLGMLFLFVVDFAGIVAKVLRIPRIRHIDFKTTIVSIGLFATFFGVLIGLYGFDSKNISDSVPKLLEGLRFAFAASVLGMGLSLTLSIIHKFSGEGEEEEGVLVSIDRKMGAMVATFESPAELVRQFTEMKSFLKHHLEHINVSLDKALVQLAQGATKEVIQALEKIILEFNQNLQEQFGENFKELNIACHKMVEWQGNYKVHIDSAEKGLTKIMSTLEQSCEAVTELTQQNSKTAETCREVAKLVSTYDVQIKTLEAHLQSCRELGVQARDFLTQTEQALSRSSENMNVFSDAIEQSVGKQSESLAKLTQDIDQQLPKALGELEKVLTNITHQFAADYRSLFQFITDKR